jgi:hypothetical protein
LTISKSLGLGELTNQRITFGRCFVDDFPVGTDLVFIDFSLVSKGCERFRMHASPLKGVPVRISESEATQFLLIIF